MKIEAGDLPVNEQETFYYLKNLPKNEKQTLWILIRKSNKDHICVIEHITPAIRSLIAKKLISVNKSFRHSSKTSLFILRQTPHLMKKLQELGQEY
jgi:hypothetical protein